MWGFLWRAQGPWRVSEEGIIKAREANQCHCYKCSKCARGLLGQTTRINQMKRPVQYGSQKSSARCNLRKHMQPDKRARNTHNTFEKGGGYTTTTEVFPEDTIALNKAFDLCIIIHIMAWQHAAVQRNYFLWWWMNGLPGSASDCCTAHIHPTSINFIRHKLYQQQEYPDSLQH